MIPYVRFEYDESIEARKEILTNEISALKIIKRIESYKRLRKQELVKKFLLKRSLRQSMTKLNSLLALFPEIETSGLKKVKQDIAKYEQAEKPIISKKSRDIEAQLFEIREKLSRLS